MFYSFPFQSGCRSHRFISAGVQVDRQTLVPTCELSKCGMGPASVANNLLMTHQPQVGAVVSSESRNAEQPRVGVRAHRQASSASLLLRRPDRALLPAPAAAAEPGHRPSRGQQQQQQPGPRPELRRPPGQRRGLTDGHHPGGPQQRLSPGRGGRIHNRRSLLVGYEVLLRGCDRSGAGQTAPPEAGML